MIYKLLSQIFVIGVYVLFPQNILDWGADSANFFGCMLPHLTYSKSSWLPLKQEPRQNVYIMTKAKEVVNFDKLIQFREECTALVFTVQIKPGAGPIRVDGPDSPGVARITKPLGPDAHPPLLTFPPPTYPPDTFIHHAAICLEHL